jgi:hypothetical protein
MHDRVAALLQHRAQADDLLREGANIVFRCGYGVGDSENVKTVRHKEFLLSAVSEFGLVAVLLGIPGDRVENRYRIEGTLPQLKPSARRNAAQKMKGDRVAKRGLTLGPAAFN